MPGEAGAWSRHTELSQPRSSNPAATLEQVADMKEYIEQALANIAYSITHATQKVDICILESSLSSYQYQYLRCLLAAP